MNPNPLVLISRGRVVRPIYTTGRYAEARAIDDERVYDVFRFTPHTNPAGHLAPIYDFLLGHPTLTSFCETMIYVLDDGGVMTGDALHEAIESLVGRRFQRFARGGANYRAPLAHVEAHP